MKYILQHVLKSVIQYRQANAQHFVPMEHARALAPDYLPWTIVNNVGGLYNTIFAQVETEFKQLNIPIHHTTTFISEHCSLYL